MEEKEFEQFVANLVIALALLAIVGLVATAKPKTTPDYYSALYLVPGSYENTAANGLTGFTYAIENHEAGDQEYAVALGVDGRVVETRKVRAAKEGKVEERVELPIPQAGYSKPAKVTITTAAAGRQYEVYYWLLPP
ncbi:MAG: hypothetical protein J4203_07170 [Candidatus Diapherotrites archaeon]|uniref:DUF1616 domain-containing protein n=1 Tax=Candidatus Iainarchaeum sp. TaxID=3101447 RepID=A0A8T4LK68_9ARCH|nr:hypothetical protein [Candidatus Diapherotrites archaeon]